ncbi:MAG TPA: DUF1501 domain-containing protein [Gemmataceae bacterium]|jgi:uncharacterized protein (DUF1501 family)|nr:DUF1501 domain-containing protein [Gemmataceae bacterium]
MFNWDLYGGGLSRRDALKLAAAGVTGVSLSGWLGVLAGRAAATQAKHKACILLWMDGGPSHKDTFDMKPGTANAGEFQPIPTAVPGLQISEHFPKLAKLMNHAAVVRGMSTGEGAHGRAKYYLHTGYKEGQGGLTYPSLGAIVSAELGRPQFPLPNFVSVGNRSFGPGFLGARHQPLIVTDPARGVENLKSPAAADHFRGRVGLLEEMEQAFFREHKAGAATDHRTTYHRAMTLMKSREAKAFDLALEPAASRAAYGKSRFGDGCLLARRLVEAGVSFVEVTLGGWDTHQNNFERVKTLSQQADPAMSALIADLRQRGMLDSTLVLWMGEFGRTPKINARGAKPGRDHYPRAWSAVLAGGGVKGGQVVGKTDKEGATVVERPTSALDFMATVCRLLGIDYNKQNIANSRPIRIVDKGAKPLTELL